MSSENDVFQAADLNRRFSGLDRLYGLTAASAVQQSHVVVVGIGGVGSWTAEALARSGVGQLTLIDMDHIAESNINRQVHSLSSTVGMAKVEAMRERIAQINPACRVHCVDDFVSPDNWPALLASRVDAVIDACDQVRAKTTMANWACRTGAVFVTVGAAGGKRLAHLVDVADLGDVTHDPLLAQLRYQLRRHHGAKKPGKKMGVMCVFSREPVRPADASCSVQQGDSSLNCHGYGSIVTVTGSFGLCAAGWVIDKISETASSKA